MKTVLLCLILFTSIRPVAQELYVFTEPASNMPARSISTKVTGHFVSSDQIYGRFSQRYMPQVMLGISKNLMLHAGFTFGNMHTTSFRYESVNFYAKYRFFSRDDIHKHFRMAAFIDGSKTNAPFHYDEITLMGDKSGIEAGVVATQLWNKFALSGTLSHVQVLDKSRNDKVLYVPARIYQAMSYSLSGGYLLLPREYTNYDQLNVNVYVELLAQQSLDISRYFVDLAPALQFILNSNTKVSIGYRVQVGGTMQRMADHNWLLSLERTFLNAWKKKAAQ